MHGTCAKKVHHIVVVLLFAVIVLHSRGRSISKGFQIMWKSKDRVIRTCFLAFVCIQSTWQSQRQLLVSFWADTWTKNDIAGAETTININNNKSPPRPAPPNDADGCYHVFIDVGANIGVHARFLFEPHKYPMSNQTLEMFDREFGINRNNQDICAFEIEVNSVHAKAHEQNAAAYKAMGWRYHYMPYAASDQDDTMMEFYHQDRDIKRGNVSEWGFSSSTFK
jgi:hypothetical protein